MYLNELKMLNLILVCDFFKSPNFNVNILKIERSLILANVNRDRNSIMRSNEILGFDLITQYHR